MSSRRYCGTTVAHFVTRITGYHGTSMTSTNNCVAGVVNAIFVFVTFLLSLPALFLPTNRGWLRTQGWLLAICATFTLGLGLAIWVETLETRRHLSGIWGRERPLTQSLLQQKVSRVLSVSARPNIGPRGEAPWIYMQSDADKDLVRLLRLHELDHASVRTGQHLHKPPCCCAEGWLHRPVLVGRQQVSRPNIHSRFWNRWCRRHPYPLRRHGTQVQDRARALPPH